jgi:hypothetical protein
MIFFFLFFAEDGSGEWQIAEAKDGGWKSLGLVVAGECDWS